MKPPFCILKKYALTFLLGISFLNGFSQVETLPTGSFIINMGTPVQTFNNGLISYSEIRKVNFGKLGSVLVYPNPVASGSVNITVTGSMVGKAATVSIYSVDAKLISVVKFEKINQTENIDVSKLSNDSYILKITTLTEVVNVQLEKIN
jgi:Secretion system C-terminal sorting domain